MKWTSAISPESIDAPLFDLDGVLTPAADTHVQSLKPMINKHLGARSTEGSIAPRTPDVGTDSHRSVNSKPCDDGVGRSLALRQTVPPVRLPHDLPGRAVCDLENRKNELTKPKNVAPTRATVSSQRPKNWSQTPC